LHPRSFSNSSSKERAARNYVRERESEVHRKAFEVDEKKIPKVINFAHVKFFKTLYIIRQQE
jgi:hypothetical protein